MLVGLCRHDIAPDTQPVQLKVLAHPPFSLNVMITWSLDQSLSSLSLSAISPGHVTQC